MFFLLLGTRAGATRNLILSDPAQEASLHSKEALLEALLEEVECFSTCFLSSSWSLLHRSSFASTLSLSYLGLKRPLLPPGSRCRDSERSGENEVFSGVEGGSTSPGSSSRPPSTSSSKEPLKVMPAPPPKENAWAKRSAASTGSNEGDGRAPISPVSPGGSAPPKFRWALTEWSLQCLNSALEWMNENE